MREFDVTILRDTVSNMIQKINYEYPPDIKSKIDACATLETHPIGIETFRLLQENARIAKEEHIPVCQDTGMVIVFLKVGQDVHFINGNLKDAINEGVRRGYEDGYLRKSVVSDPLFHRVNTKDNTPAVLYMDIVEGDQVEVSINCKGFGSENMSTITMLKPAQGVQGVKQAVLDTVKKAGPNACPPMVIGVGIGGTFDYAAVLAKKALTRSSDCPHPNKEYANLEKELLDEINQLHIGPQGLGGNITALHVNIEDYPTHIAGMPLAVNISCHITRHAKEVL